MKDDILEKVESLLINDDIVKEYTYSNIDEDYRIKFYEYPETADVSGPHIILESYINGMPSSYADETWVTLDYLIHVEVWSNRKEDSYKLSNHIRKILWDNLGMKQNDDLEEYDEGVYRVARRYIGKLHRSDLEDISL